MSSSDQSRRRALEAFMACIGGSVLSACGGGSAEAVASVEPAVSPSGAPLSAPTPSPAPPPVSAPAPAPAPAPVPIAVTLPPLPPPVPPYAGQPTALDRFAATVSAGALSEFAAPSMADKSRTGSYPFDAPAAAIALGIGDHLLDWATMMDYDTFTRKYFVSGGRPRNLHEPLKMVVYDEVGDDWTSVDQWAPLSACGHLYRSTTVMSELRLVAYLPAVSNMNGNDMIELWNINEGKFFASLPHAPTTLGGFSNSWLGSMFLCWFPTMGSKGSLIFANSSRSRVVRFDWASLTWSALGNFDGEWTNQHLNGHFHPVLGKMIVGSSEAAAPRRLAIIDRDGSMSLTTRACPVSMTCSGTIGGPFFPHATKPLSILFDRETYRIWTYNWTTDTWTDRAPVPPELANGYTIALPHPTGGGALFAAYRSAGRTRTFYWKPPAEWN